MNKFKPFLLLPDEMYYITCQREDIPFFEERDDYVEFLNNYQTELAPYVDTFAYCLTSHSIYLLIRFRSPTKLNGASKAQQQLANYNFDLLRKVLPEVATEAIECKPVPQPAQQRDTIHLIHNVPVEEGFIKSMSRWEFSSYRGYITGKAENINREEGLTWFGGAEGFLKFHRKNK